MENIIDNNSNSGMTLNSESLNHLNQTRKWTMFLSILGFISLGIIIIVAIGFQSIMSNMSSNMKGMGEMESMSGIITVLYIAIAALYFYPIYCLFQFSKTSKDAVENNNSSALQESFRHQKNMYKYMGILTIIVLGFYVLALIIGLSAGLAMR